MLLSLSIQYHYRHNSPDNNSSNQKQIYNGVQSRQNFAKDAAKILAKRHEFELNSIKYAQKPNKSKL